ncbi:MAG: M28 family peptidase, partial [Ardenticatenales bacterium]|nr:M28 family peptidase [Ardenticatenales bacterium]
MGDILSPRARWQAMIVVLLLLGAAILLSVLRLQAPAALPSSAPPDQFSAGRAMVHTEAISRAPHPIGSPEQVAVREYLVRTLTDLGLETETQSAIALVGNGLGENGAGTANNVMARLKGSEGSQALALVAHYDTAPTSFGANDDGVAISAILETIRALQEAPALRNDIIVLFTDGEEVGSIGAQAFLEEHPWAKSVRVVLNFDARGTAGPSMMFETSPENGWLVQEFAQGASRPFANSLSFEVYQLLAFQTDFTFFKRAGVSGFNFSYLDGYTGYHSQLDRFDSVDPRSLQHHGLYALELSRHLGNMDLSQTQAENAVYFDVLQLLLIYYPASWALPLALLCLLLFGGIIALGLQKKRLAMRGLGLGFLASLLVVALGAGLATLLWQLVALVHSDYAFTFLDTYNNGLYRVAFLLLAVAFGLTAYRQLSSRVGLLPLALGSLLIWLILAVTSAIVIPGASYLFTWPLLFALLPIAWFIKREQNIEQPTLSQTILLTFFSLPAVLILFPTALQLSITLGVRYSNLLVGLILLLMGTLILLYPTLLAPDARLLPGLSLLVGLLFLLGGSATAGFDAQRPRPSNLFYALDADTGKAVWATQNRQLDEWTSSFIADGERTSLTTIFPAYPTFRPFQKETAG